MTIQSWMYHVFYGFVLLAAAGLCRMRWKPTLWVLLTVYIAFWAGQLYNVLLLFVSKGVSTSMGWYMYAVVGAEVVLCVAGLRALCISRFQTWIPAMGVFAFALLDLYTLNCVAIPYYTGMIAHRPNGSIAALHLEDVLRVGVPEVFKRLAIYKGDVVTESLVIALWCAYILATGVLAVIAIRCARAYQVGSDGLEPPSNMLRKNRTCWE